MNRSTAYDRENEEHARWRAAGQLNFNGCQVVVPLNAPHERNSRPEQLVRGLREMVETILIVLGLYFFVFLFKRWLWLILFGIGGLAAFFAITANIHF
jgi:hypothetical protein